MKNLKSITLEMSLKPFKSVQPEYLEKVCRQMFTDWGALLKSTDMVSVMLWSSDGSEILEYKGILCEEFEWAKYIGIVNKRDDWDKTTDPQGRNLHTRSYLYIENPPVFTYQTLKTVIETIKTIGHQLTGKPIRVGATFDPGPEFAKSAFKYEKHPEILMGDAMGKASFVCCYGVLHADCSRYVGYPNGIPEGTPFGTFFGKQSQRFLSDLGFDYIWFSNGFGFGSESWCTTGSVFNGKRFLPEKMDETQKRILEFWRLFRNECNFRVETRGTNLTVGIDLATDAVNIQKIYEGGFDILPPPNSPWAALDGDFGLELAGYMSRIAELPKDGDFLFRFYVHDPWWMNSPWIDRYESQPHDIYLPLAVSRIDKNGDITMPNYLNLLTIDNSLGEMPEQCPNEITPHLLKAYENEPDEASPFVWVYPFREYSELAAGRMEKPFFEDWFVRGAINNGLPLSTVISTDNFISTINSKPEMYQGLVLVTPVPERMGAMNSTLIEFIQAGGKVMIYGSLENASDNLMMLLNLSRSLPVDGDMHLTLGVLQDSVASGTYSERIYHDVLMSDGCIDTVLSNCEDPYTQILAHVTKGEDIRIAAVYRSCTKWNGGAVVWIRGTNCSQMKTGMHILSPFNPEEYFPLESLMRLAAVKFGYEINYVKETPAVKNPVIMIHRHDNAFYFSGYVPDTTVLTRLKMPLGAPVLMGSETRIINGMSTYSMPRAWNSECRVFVEQSENSVVSCNEIAPVSFQLRRRLLIKGLKNATVRILPRKGFEDKTELLINPMFGTDIIGGESIKCLHKKTEFGFVIEVENVSGTLLISDCYA